MSGAMAGLILGGAVVSLIVLRQYLLVVLFVVAGFAWYVWGDGHLENVVLDGWDALNQDVLLPIPLYLLAGAIMAEGGIASRLIRVMRAIVGPIPGGLAVATALSCGLFSAIVGSSTVALGDRADEGAQSARDRAPHAGGGGSGGVQVGQQAGAAQCEHPCGLGGWAGDGRDRQGGDPGEQTAADVVVAHHVGRPAMPWRTSRVARQSPSAWCGPPRAVQPRPSTTERARIRHTQFWGSARWAGSTSTARRPAARTCRS